MSNRIFKLFLFLLSTVIVATGCAKVNLGWIDVSEQWLFDRNGNSLGGPNDNQWRQQAFTKREEKLFESLDTANVSGTTQPAAVGNNRQTAYPNPFQYQQMLALRVDPSYSGNLLLKLVIVDSRFKVVQKNAVKVSFNSGFISVAMAPNFPAGKYRLYFTLSAEGKPHFFTTWGNIEKTN